MWQSLQITGFESDKNWNTRGGAVIFLGNIFFNLDSAYRRQLHTAYQVWGCNGELPSEIIIYKKLNTDIKYGGDIYMIKLVTTNQSI